MAPHMERVYAERDELDAKVAKLDSFVSTNSLFGDLDDTRRDLLLTQLHCMRAYAAVLDMRIKYED